MGWQRTCIDVGTGDADAWPTMRIAKATKREMRLLNMAKDLENGPKEVTTGRRECDDKRVLNGCQIQRSSCGRQLVRW